VKVKAPEWDDLLARRADRPLLLVRHGSPPSSHGPITRDIPNFAVTPEEFIAAGDTVAVVVRYTGTGKDTGKQLDLPVAHVWDVDNGKIAKFRQFIDTAKFLEVVPAS
jgi:ketosteroid isomerase-like protein